MSKIAIVIINFNNISDTLACLESLTKIKASKFVFDIYLVDNGSKPQIGEQLISPLQKELSIKLLNLGKNYGFAEGNNIGIREAQKVGYDYYILLNNDTEVVDSSIEQMIKLMDEHPEVGIGGLVNYYYSDPETIWQAGAIFNKSCFCYSQISVLDRSSKVLTEVDYVPGSSFFIRKEVIDKIGLLDPNYFAYREEADYCWRAKQAGFKVGFIPNSKILHKVGKSSTSFLKQYLRFRNELYFCSKFGTFLNYISVYTHIIRATFSYWRRNQYNMRYIKVTILSIIDYHSNNMGYGSIDKVLKIS